MLKPVPITGMWKVWTLPERFDMFRLLVP